MRAVPIGLALACLLAVPAGAKPTPGVRLADDTGDANWTSANTLTGGVPAPGALNDPAADITSVEVKAVYAGRKRFDGVVVTLTLAAAPAASNPVRYVVGLVLDCAGRDSATTLTYDSAPRGSGGPQGRLDDQCTTATSSETRTTPLAPVVAGATITWRLSARTVPAGVLQGLHQGAAVLLRIATTQPVAGGDATRAAQRDGQLVSTRDMTVGSVLWEIG